MVCFFLLPSSVYAFRMSPMTRIQPLILECRVNADSGTVSRASKTFHEFVFYINSVYRLPSIEQPINKEAKPTLA